MNIFLGSSREALNIVDWVAMCLQEYGHKPVRWDEPGLFPPGCNTFHQLIEISKTVDAAVFIFATDDKVWYRGDTAAQPRDNVLIEYGLFAGTLGPSKAIMCVHEKPKAAADLAGITYIDVTEQRRNRARLELNAWLNNLTSKKIDQATLQLMAKVSEQESARQQLERELQFEKEKSEELQDILAKKGVIELRPANIEPSDYWALLYEFDFYWEVSLQMASIYKTPGEIAEKSHFSTAGIQWDQFYSDSNHTAFFARKVLRNSRRGGYSTTFNSWIEQLPVERRNRIDSVAKKIKAQNFRAGS